MDKFREIQANLCGGRDGGNDAPGDRQHYGPWCDHDDDNNAFLYPCIPVLQHGVDGHQPLPVPIDGDLPHFVINIGHSTSALNLSLTPCVDTGAGANVGYIGYFDGILFQHLECVEQIFCVNEEEYSYIRMTVIVSEDTTGSPIHTCPLQCGSRQATVTVTAGVSVSPTLLDHLSPSISLSAMLG